MDDLNDMQERIRKMLCTIHTHEGLTISEAQTILGEGADADDLFSYMLKEKLLMKSMISTNGNGNGSGADRYEFTFLGLKELFACFLREYMGEKQIQITDRRLIDELDFATYCHVKIRRIAGENVALDRRKNLR